MWAGLPDDDQLARDEAQEVGDGHDVLGDHQGYGLTSQDIAS